MAKKTITTYKMKFYNYRVRMAYYFDSKVCDKTVHIHQGLYNAETMQDAITMAYKDIAQSFIAMYPGAGCSIEAVTVICRRQP